MEPGWSEAMEKPKKSVDLTRNPIEGDAENDGNVGSFSVFMLMEDLIDKLKLLNYEKEYVKELNIKPFSKYMFIL